MGDDVVVCAKLVNYRGNTPETVQGATYLYSLNGQTGGGDTPGPGTEGEAKGSGTKSDPWNAVAANNFAKSLSADTPSPDNYYIKGKIAKIANNGLFSAQYGNASFYISDDGKDENTFYVFRTLFLENKKWVEGNTQIKVGDEVVIYGKLVNYKATSIRSTGRRATTAAAAVVAPTRPTMAAQVPTATPTRCRQPSPTTPAAGNT